MRVLLEKMETLDRLGTGSLPGGSAGLPVAADQPAVAAEERGNVSLMDTDTSGTSNGKIKPTICLFFFLSLKKWPDKSITSYAMLDFESDIENL